MNWTIAQFRYLRGEIEKVAYIRTLFPAPAKGSNIVSLIEGIWYEILTLSINP
jgi:hypothetical protein